VPARARRPRTADAPARQMRVQRGGEAVAVASNASGGHVNPVVTFGLLVGRRISFGRAAVYWLAQMLGVVVASLLLTLVSSGTVIYTK
jgi:glycerol uptake facilitator-like aquaporin